MADLPFHEIKLDAWPIVQVIVNRPPVDDDEFDVFQDAFIGLLEGVIADQTEHGHTDRIAMVMKLDGIVEASLAQKFRAVMFIRTVKPLVTPTIQSTALVIRSSTVRAIIEFILALQPLQSEHAVFESTEAAITWSEEQRA